MEIALPVGSSKQRKAADGLPRRWGCSREGGGLPPPRVSGRKKGLKARVTFTVETFPFSSVVAVAANTTSTSLDVEIRAEGPLFLDLE